jgi:hypothetical protein
MELTFKRNGTTTIGLDGVQEQYETYRRRGFESVGKILLMTRDSLASKPVSQPFEYLGAARMHDIQDVDPKELAHLDYEHTGLDRSAYWSVDSLLSRPDSFGYAMRVPGSCRVTGFVFVRPSQSGHRFGPLYAETYAQAKSLLYMAMSAVVGSEGYVAEISGNNVQGKECFEELGWEFGEQNWFHRMWLGGRAPKEQQEGGKGRSGMYAVFDAASG